MSTGRDSQIEQEPKPLGYLVSQYPATNHTFILREICKLRELGFDIRVVSIRKPDRPPAALSEEEAAEFRQTSYVLGSGASTIAGAHLWTFFGAPLGYVAAFFSTLGLAGWNLRGALHHTFYFAEAVVAGHLFRKQGVAHAHTHFASTVALLMSRVFPISFSMTIHGPDEFNDVAGFHLAEKAARARIVAAISRFAASQTMSASDPRHWTKIHALPLGVDPDAFAPRPPPPPDAPFEILCVARLAPVKAHVILVDAIGQLVAAGRTGVRLVLVGEGPARASIAERVASQGLGAYVRLEGALNHDRVLEFYRRASVFALPSFAEGVPVVLMEAMAMEVPCVATWIAGVPELIRADVDGLLIPPADPDALAAAIARLMDNPELAARLGHSGRIRVLERYHLARNTERLAAVFREYLRVANGSQP